MSVPVSIALLVSVLTGAYTTLIVQVTGVVAAGRVAPHVPGLVVARAKSAVPVNATAILVNGVLLAGFVKVSVTVLDAPRTTNP